MHTFMPCVKNFKNSLIQVYSPLSAWHQKEIDNILMVSTRDGTEDQATAKRDNKLHGEDPFE